MEPVANFDPQSESNRGNTDLLDPALMPDGLDHLDYEAMFKHSLDGILFSAPDGRILAANPGACAILGYTEAEICRLGRSGILVLEDPRTVSALRTREQQGSARAEIPLRRADGSVFTADVSSTIFVTARGEQRACVFFRDITEQLAIRERLQEQSEKLERLSRQDALTGLLNLRGFRLAVEQTFAIADRQNLTVQLLFIDLDDFKAINDQLGHAVGDEVLRRFAAAVTKTVRAVDRAARLGGDEFAVLAVGAKRDDAQLVLDRISSALASPPGQEPAIRFSAGIVERTPASPMSLDQLLEQADAAMYREKARKPSGRPRSGSSAPPEC